MYLRISPPFSPPLPLYLHSFSGVTITHETNFTSADLTNAKNVDKVIYVGDSYLPVFRQSKRHQDPNGARFAKQFAMLMAGEAIGSALAKVSDAADAAGLDGDGGDQHHRINVLHTNAAQF